MRLKISTTVSLLALSLAACSPGFTGTTASGGKPMGVASTAPGASSKEPESANSLPPGDAISGPVTSRIGNVGTTRY